MPQQLITINTPSISVNIPDSQSGLKRKAVLNNLMYNQAKKSVSLYWDICYVDSEGEVIKDKGIQGFLYQNEADNKSVVNASTGVPIGKLLGTSIVLNELDANNQQVILNPDEEGNYEVEYPIMLQYDWFYQIGSNQPIIVHQLIQQFAALTNWP